MQEFIAQARRTRDLWYGSHLLSELSRRAARAIVDCGGDLIFPPGQNDQAISNKLLAQLGPSLDPAQVAAETRDSVMSSWHDIAEQVKQNCSGLLAPAIDAVWAEQVGTFIEFFAAWAPSGDYQRTRSEVERGLAARKRLREFSQWQDQRGSVPKSSFDGARETVLLPPVQRDPVLTKKYRISPGEQLDAVALIKRAGGQPAQFIPIVNVALSPWLRAAETHYPQLLEALRNACKAQGIAQVTPDLPATAMFPYDASVLLAQRWSAVFEEQELEGDPSAWGNQYVGPLLEKLGEPDPYVACLVADGDRMGRFIDLLTTSDDHRQFSAVLATFAQKARTIVEEHSGSLVFAGGDDVLAFLPLSEALRCADHLRRQFEAVGLSAGSADTERPTLSIGIGIGHLMESMGDLLALGREAEYLAKHGIAGSVESSQRNAIAILLNKRSGGRRIWRSQWNEWNGDPVGRLIVDTSLSALSTGKIYEIERVLRTLPRPAYDVAPSWEDVLLHEVRRLLARVNAGESSFSLRQAGLELTEGRGYTDVYESTRSWIDRLLIARAFARSTVAVPQAGSGS